MKICKTWRTAPGRTAGAQRGAAAVEMAILLPLLLLLVFGVIEFGVYLYNQQVLTNACREGARAGIVQREDRLTQDEICAIVNSYADGRLVTFDGGSTTPNTSVSSDGTATFDNLTVTTTYNYSFFVVASLIPGFQNPRLMTARAVMKYE
jgi:Flp pilus assembly protein TadG